MIRLIEDYVVVKEPYDFMLAREMNAVDKKTGKKKLRAIGYYGSLYKAIEACRKDYIGKFPDEGDMSLSEALTQLRTQDKRFRRIMEEAMRGVEV